MPSPHEPWICACGNVRVDPDAGRLSVRDENQFEISKIIDVRAGFSSKVVTLPSPVGDLLLGVVDPHIEGVADSVSWLLFRSIRDALGSTGGHLPDWLVDDIRRNYISPDKVRTLWAARGYRFALVHANTGEMVGTIHIARSHHTILTVNRDINNARAEDYPGFKPDGGHHVVNISVQHEWRRAHLGRLMVNGILEHFLDLFDGNALWVRADPPWHAGLLGLGFSHDPSMDIFLPASVEKTRNLSHAEFNALYACDCGSVSPAKPDFLKLRTQLMQTEKLQYVSMLRPFVSDIIRSGPQHLRVNPIDPPAMIDPGHSTDFGGVFVRSPQTVVAPRNADEAADLLARASVTRTPVTVRGLGQSAGGQSLSKGGILLLTQQFDSICVEESKVSVGGGVRWDQLLDATLAQGLMPPVVPGYLSTTVGGTLSSGGFSKGSIMHGMLIDHVLELDVITADGRRVLCGPTQAAWLFHSVLGGLGQFGVIAGATLSLVPAPQTIVTETMECVEDVSALLERFAQFAKEPERFHATVFVESNGHGGLRHKAVFARKSDETNGIPLARYLNPVRPAAPPSRSIWAHVFAPVPAVATLLEQARALVSFERGDTLQWLPCCKKGPGGSLVRTANVPRESLHYAILLSRNVNDTPIDQVVEENQQWLNTATSLGAKNALGGLIPNSPESWRHHLGNRYADVIKRAVMADPAGILDSLGLRERRH